MIKLLFLLLLSLAQTASAKSIVFPSMGRMFTLVLPNNSSSKPKPLLVLLHGCKQNPKLILEGTRMEEEALKNDFMVLAPEQSLMFNMDHCWNWFLSSQQDRNMINEMGQIMTTIDMMKSVYQIDEARIFVAGMSAGGAMAHNLAVCYPEYFKGAAIHSGLSYKIAENLEEAQTVLTIEDQKSPEYMGKQAYACASSQDHKLNRLMIIHGSKDPRVNPVHAELISKTNDVWWDYLDDHHRNSSTRAKTEKTSSRGGAYQVTKTEKHYPYNNMVEQKIIIEGMAHAWGGGKPVSVNFDPLAPSSTDFILKFFELK